MSNQERWDCYTSGLCSPQNFLDWSLRFIIASALQRRVAFGCDPKSGHMPVFPNTYTVLVGKAGVGKGIVVNPAMDMLKFHKRKDFIRTSDTATEQEKLVSAKVEQANLEDSEATTQKLKRGGEKIEPTLFPYAPDATTYEKLVEEMGNSFRRINYVKTESTGEQKLDIYGHCSMYFALPELGSLLRKRTDDVVNYLLGLYDCPLDYEYKTKTNGCDRVRRGCLNLLAGTTPEFMETVFNQKLIDQGFSSRVFFIYATKNRKHVFMPAALTDEQITCRNELLNHIKELAKLYGEVKPELGVMEFLQEWWSHYQEHPETHSSNSPKLAPYKARKNIHVIKLALQEHFKESLSMTIGIEPFKKAIDILHEEEKNMHMALTFESDNPLGNVSDKIVDYLKVKSKLKKVDLLCDFWKALPQGEKSLDEVLVYLISSQKIEESREPNKITQREEIYYKAIV